MISSLLKKKKQKQKHHVVFIFLISSNVSEIFVVGPASENQQSKTKILKHLSLDKKQLEGIIFIFYLSIFGIQ